VNCNCKKPKTGMIKQIQQNYQIDFDCSYVIGDMGKSDMMLANSIKSKSILVLTGVGKESLEEFRHTWADVEPTHIVSNILDASILVE